MKKVKLNSDTIIKEKGSKNSIENLRPILSDVQKEIVQEQMAQSLNSIRKF
jgi:hypothetical protein